MDNSVRLHVGLMQVDIPHQTVLDLAMANFPDLITAPFNSLSPQEQTFRLGLKPVCRLLLGMMAWAAGEFDKEGKYPRPLAPEQLVREDLDILVYTAQYIMTLALIACSEKDWNLDVVPSTAELDPTAPQSKQAIASFVVTGLHPGTAEVDRPSDVGEGERERDSGASGSGPGPVPSYAQSSGRYPDYAERPLGDSGRDGNGQDDVQQAADVGVSSPLPTEA